MNTRTNFKSTTGRRMVGTNLKVSEKIPIEQDEQIERDEQIENSYKVDEPEDNEFKPNANDLKRIENNFKLQTQERNQRPHTNHLKKNPSNLPISPVPVESLMTNDNNEIPSGPRVFTQIFQSNTTLTPFGRICTLITYVIYDQQKFAYTVLGLSTGYAINKIGNISSQIKNKTQNINSDTLGLLLCIPTDFRYPEDDANSTKNAVKNALKKLYPTAKSIDSFNPINPNDKSLYIKLVF